MWQVITGSMTGGRFVKRVAGDVDVPVDDVADCRKSEDVGTAVRSGCREGDMICVGCTTGSPSFSGYFVV